MVRGWFRRASPLCTERSPVLTPIGAQCACVARAAASKRLSSRAEMAPQRNNPRTVAAARFSATARPDRGRHRWDVRVFDASNAAPRLTYGSCIGGRDVDQRVEFPPQAMDCRLEIRSSHETATGWADDRATCLDDTPDRLLIGFCDPARPGGPPDDVLLGFAFCRAAVDQKKQ